MPRDIPGTRSLKVLEAAGRHLNFTRAGAELNLTPAAVSHQIKEWETQLGIALFVRTRRSLQLTPAGEILHGAAAETLENLGRAVTQARRIAGKARVQLNITAPTSLAAKWLVPRLDRFSKLAPSVDVRLNATCRILDFRRDNIDLAIRFLPGESGLQTDRLFDHAIYPVCSPDFLHGQSSVTAPHDLIRQTLLHQSWKGHGVDWPDWRTWLQAAGVDNVDFEPGLHYTDTHLAVQAAIEGKGIALGDDALVADDLAAGRLVRPFDLSIGGPPGFAYFVVSPPDKIKNPLVASFRTWLLTEARSEAP